MNLIPNFIYWLCHDKFAWVVLRNGRGARRVPLKRSSGGQMIVRLGFRWEPVEADGRGCQDSTVKWWWEDKPERTA